MVGWAEPCYKIIDNGLDSLSVGGFSLMGGGRRTLIWGRGGQTQYLYDMSYIQNQWLDERGGDRFSIKIGVEMLASRK